MQCQGLKVKCVGGLGPGKGKKVAKSASVIADSDEEEEEETPKKKRPRKTRPESEAEEEQEQEEEQEEQEEEPVAGPSRRVAEPERAREPEVRRPREAGLEAELLQLPLQELLVRAIVESVLLREQVTVMRAMLRPTAWGEEVVEALLDYFEEAGEGYDDEEYEPSDEE